MKPWQIFIVEISKVLLGFIAFFWLAGMMLSMQQSLSKLAENTKNICIPEGLRN